MPPASATDWPRIGLVYAAGVLGAMQTGLIAPVVPVLQHDLGASLAFMGWVLSVVTGVAALLGTVVGALGAVADSGAVLLAGRIILGFGYLAVVVTGRCLPGGGAPRTAHRYVKSPARA